MRIDRLLCCLRFVKTRGLGQKLVATERVRLNGQRVVRASQIVAPGDVLTFPIGNQVRLVRVTAIPKSRGPARETVMYYEDLDPIGQPVIADGEGATPLD